MYRQATAIVERDDVTKRRRGEHRDREGDARHDEPGTARRFPQPPRHTRYAGPERCRRPTRRHHDMAAGDARGTLRDEIEEREREPRPGGEEAREPREQPREGE